MLRERDVNPKEVENRNEKVLVMSTEIFETMADEIIQHPNTETGGYLLGQRFINSGREYIAPLGTFTPKNYSEVQRSGGHLVIGGKSSVDYYDWQKAGWRARFKKYQESFGFEYDEEKDSSKLKLLGIWHKHPGTFIQPSGTDLNQVKHHLQEGIDSFLFPISVVIGRKMLGMPGLAHSQAVRHTIDEKTAIDTVFYYMEKGDFEPRILEPHLIRRELLPELNPNPWHVESPELLEQEAWGLSKRGFEVTLALVPVADGPEPEVWLSLEHEELGERVISLKTSRDFDERRVFEVKFGSVTSKKEKVGKIVLEQDVRIVDFIEPIVDFALAERREDERKA